MNNNLSEKMTNDKTTEQNRFIRRSARRRWRISATASIAYVKSIRSEDVASLFPQAPKIAPGLKLFALHAADGTPIMLTDSREAAIANAWSQELETVSVH